MLWSPAVWRKSTYQQRLSTAEAGAAIRWKVKHCCSSVASHWSLYASIGTTFNSMLFIGLITSFCQRGEPLWNTLSIEHSFKKQQRRLVDANCDTQCIYLLIADCHTNVRRHAMSYDGLQLSMQITILDGKLTESTTWNASWRRQVYGFDGSSSILLRNRFMSWCNLSQQDANWVSGLLTDRHTAHKATRNSWMWCGQTVVARVMFNRSTCNVDTCAPIGLQLNYSLD